MFRATKEKGIPTLADLDYNAEKHDAGLEAIRARKLGITQAVEALVELYEKLYQVDAYHINCGLCEDFGADLKSLFPEAISDWGDYFTNKDEDDDVEKYMYHCIVFYQGKYYDSEHPQGVENFRDISAFHQ